MGNNLTLTPPATGIPSQAFQAGAVNHRRYRHLLIAQKKKPAAELRFRQRVLADFRLWALLFSFRFELLVHNHERAATPIMMGTMIRVPVVAICFAQAHKVQLAYTRLSRPESNRSQMEW
jgi:hypothetical protein